MTSLKDLSRRNRMDYPLKGNPKRMVFHNQKKSRKAAQRNPNLI